jgi:Tol biopolymer transport system component
MAAVFRVPEYGFHRRGVNRYDFSSPRDQIELILRIALIQEVCVKNEVLAVDSDYQFSPDGVHFRFALSNQTTSISSLWEARRDGTGLHEILPGWNKPPAECCGRWPPDGKYFVFRSVQNGSGNVWALPEKAPFGRTVNHVPIQLTTGPLEIFDVIPAKDGKQIFVVGSQPKGELTKFDTKTSQFVPVLGGISAGDVDYSRDGSWITYVLYPEGTLWRSRADGSERQQLTYSPMNAALAHWSPDGRQIAFSASGPGRPWRVFVISADGGTPQPISSSDESETDPTWSADGQTITFGHNAQEEGEKNYIGMFAVGSRQIARLAGLGRIFCAQMVPRREMPRRLDGGQFHPDALRHTSANLEEIAEASRADWLHHLVSRQHFPLF